MRRRLARQRGINLIEVLIAFVVLAVAFLGLIEVFPSAYMASTQAKDMMIATQLAQTYLDEEMAMDFDDLANRTLSEEMANTSQGAATKSVYDVTVQIDPPVTPTVNKVRITVFVTYQTRGGIPRPVRLESSRTRTIDD